MSCKFAFNRVRRQCSVSLVAMPNNMLFGIACCYIWEQRLIGYKWARKTIASLQWRHGVSNHRRLGCWLENLFRCRSKKTSKLRVTDLCEGNNRWPVDSPHKGPVTRKMFPFDDVTMILLKHKYRLFRTWRTIDHARQRQPALRRWSQVILLE